MASNVAQHHRGTFIISLDFELYWGVRDKRRISDYRDNLVGVHVVVPKMLKAFEKHDIHASWAAVGFLFFKDKEELVQNLPESLPSYDQPELSPYGHIESNELDGKMHFAPALIEEIRRTPGQEIACHTLSHYYCLENGQSEEQFQADCNAYLRLARSVGLEVKSIVFPRNQHNQAYDNVLKQLGISAFRGNEKNILNKAGSEEDTTLLQRALRLMDAYINITGTNTYALSGTGGQNLVNLPASRFLRPFSPNLRPLEPLKLARIKSAMTKAARRGEVFHLWWHPHNFGTNQAENLSALEKILAHYKVLEKKYGMESLNMNEAAELAENL